MVDLSFFLGILTLIMSLIFFVNFNFLKCNMGVFYPIHTVDVRVR